MTTISQLPPLAEQRAALNAAWLQMERAEAERELLMELLGKWAQLSDIIGNESEPMNVYAPKLLEIHMATVAILRGEPVAEVLRPDEDPDMEVGF